MNMDVSRTVVEIIFGVCMNVKSAELCSVDDDGNVYCSTLPVEPCMVVRGFGNGDMYVEREFTDFESAWKFISALECHCRIMDNSGMIYFDDVRFGEVEK